MTKEELMVENTRLRDLIKEVAAQQGSFALNPDTRKKITDELNGSRNDGRWFIGERISLK